jgi:hypothetical protein
LRRPRNAAAAPRHACAACPQAAVAAAFAGAVRVVVEDYLRFLLDEDAGTEATKSFMARHAAARSALAHVETLLKLVGGPSGPDEFKDGYVLLDQAREALGPPTTTEDAAEEGALDGEPAPG